MAPIEVLDIDLFGTASPLSDTVIENIVRQLWRVETAIPIHIRNFDAFFTYYRAQCENEDPKSHAASTHSDIIKLVNDLQTSPPKQQTLLLFVL
jgi:hypothetical protein